MWLVNWLTTFTIESEHHPASVKCGFVNLTFYNPQSLVIVAKNQMYVCVPVSYCQQDNDWCVKYGYQCYIEFDLCFTIRDIPIFILSTTATPTRQSYLIYQILQIRHIMWRIYQWSTITSNIVQQEQQVLPQLIVISDKKRKSASHSHDCRHYHKAKEKITDQSFISSLYLNNLNCESLINSNNKGFDIWLIVKGCHTCIKRMSMESHTHISLTISSMSESTWSFTTHRLIKKTTTSTEQQQKDFDRNLAIIDDPIN